MASYLGDLGEKVADTLGMGKKKKKGFEDVKSGSSTTGGSAPTKGAEEIFEDQSGMRNFIDRARKATNKQVR